MKNLLVAVILLTVSYTELSSQCNPNYRIKSDGFICSDLGTFCILINHKDNMGCPSPNGLFVQLEFDQTDILDQNWYDFTQIQNGPTTEIYEQEITWLVEPYIDVEMCFEAKIQTPGSPITVRFIDRTTVPETVLEERDFVFDQITEIGDGGTIYLSDLIGNELLDRGTASNTAQKFRINGTLVMNEKYNFGTSHRLGGFQATNEIYFTAGSQMVLTSSEHFNFRFARITSCDGTWKGILMDENTSAWTQEVLIENAERAFDLSGDGSLIRVLSTHFVNNQYGIYNVHAQPASTTITIGGNPYAFRNKNYNRFTSNEDSHFSVDVGIKAKNIRRPIDIMGDNRFSQLTTGIDCENTDLVIGPSIDPYDPVAGFPQFLDHEDGIIVKNCKMVDIQARYQGCTSHAVVSEGNEKIIIHRSTFSSWLGRAMTIRTIEPNEIVTIEENDILSYPWGITGHIQPSMGYISNNKINTMYSNIDLLGRGSGVFYWLIEENGQLNSSNSRNMFIRNLYNTIIQNNHDVNSSGLSNIELIGGAWNWATCNVLNHTGFTNNIVLNASPIARLECNASTANAASNLSIKNNCGFSYIGTNPMTSPWYNLEYDALALTGKQKGTNNMFDASMQPKAIHYGSGDQALESQYIVKFGAAQGSPEYPFFDSDALEWFESSWSGPIVGCGDCEPSLPPGLPGDRPGGVVSEEDNANTLHDYIISGLAVSHSVEVEFDAQLKLMRSLIAMDDAGTLIGTLLTYYLANQNTEAYHLAYVDSELKKAAQMSVLDSTLVDSLYEDWRDDIDLYNSIQWYSIDTITGEVTYDSVAIAQRDQLMIDIENTSNQISSIRAPYTAAWNTALTNMQTYNAGITTTTVSGQNLKDANDVYIRYSLAGEHELNATDLATIQSIGMMCYVEGGEGVLLARNLESNHWGEVIEYSDDCSTIQPMRQAGVPQVGSLSIEPNPSEGSGEVNIEVIGSEEDIDVEVLDLSGRRIWQGNTSQMVDVSQWKGGLYLVRSLGDGGMIYRGRFVVSD